MARKLSVMKGRSEKILGFSMLIHNYFQSEEYAQLSPRAVKLLIDMYCLYRGKNNGDLCATYSVMKKVGWTSNDQLYKATIELLARGWIILARQGGRRVPHLYALTFLSIDQTNKLDRHVKPSPTRLHLWKFERRHEISLNANIEKKWNDMIKTKSVHTAKRIALNQSAVQKKKFLSPNKPSSGA